MLLYLLLKFITRCITFILNLFVHVELFTKLLKGDEMQDEELSGKEQKDHCRISAKVK